tara:strand:- start:101 stop:385 length:285 start_codon:yes stop_codon:yes gene_type:complete
MSNIFSIKDKTGRTIRLTDERWKHIAREHSQITNHEELKETLENPVIIRKSKYDSKVAWYYRSNKKKKLYLMVSVKYLNGEGFIITAFYTRKIK